MTTKIISSVATVFPWGEDFESLKIRSEKSKEYESKSVQKIHVSSSTLGGKNVIAKFSSPGGTTTKYSYNSDTITAFGREASLNMSLNSSLNYRNFEQRIQHQKALQSPVNNNGYTITTYSPGGNQPIVRQVYDNSYVSHAIPATVYGYKWIKDNSTIGTDSNGNTIRPQGSLYNPKSMQGLEVAFIESADINLDPAGTNQTFYEPVNMKTLTSGPDTLSSEGITPLLYSSYLRNKKSILFRSRAMSLWTKEQNKVVKNLNNSNYVTMSTGGNTRAYKLSPISPNNTIDLTFNPQPIGAAKATVLLSDTLSNDEIFDKVYSRASLTQEIRDNFTKTKSYLNDRNISVINFISEEMIFPNRGNSSLSYIQERHKYGNSEIDILKKTTGIRTFWHPSANNRVRPHGSSNSLDYKNSLYYNVSNNIVDSIFALDNTVLPTGQTLVGELSYQGDSFYRNLITTKRRTKGNLTSVSSFRTSPENIMDTTDLLGIEINAERQLERLNVLSNLVMAIDYKKGYQWGTSINPYDLFRNKEYYSGAHYDKDSVKLDFRKNESRRNYDNKSLILHSYPKNSKVLNSFNLSIDNQAPSIIPRPLIDDSLTSVSKENLQVKRTESDLTHSSHISSSQIDNVVFDKTPRPTLQMFYQPNEYYGKETGFKFTLADGENPPFFDSWFSFTKDLKASSEFSSIIPEFSISGRIDDYESREGKYGEKVKNILSLPGAGDALEEKELNTSRRVNIVTEKSYSLDGTHLQPIRVYPETDNNYAWYSSRNRETMLSSDSTYRGTNNTYIPADSTFSITNSVNTEYNVESSNGLNGLSSLKNSWFPIAPVVKRNAAAAFNIEDFKKDYTVTRITKFGPDDSIDLSDSSASLFSLSLWFSPNKEWFNAESELGLLSLTNGLADHRGYISILCKNSTGHLSISTSTGGQVQTYDTQISCELNTLNNLVLTHDDGDLSLHLNGIDITPSNSTFASLDSMGFINNIVLGLSYIGDEEKKYRGTIDEVILYKGKLTSTANNTPGDISKIFSGGIPTNTMEMYVNGEITSAIPVSYNRVGYPSTENIKEYDEYHDSDFFNRYVLGGSTLIPTIGDFESIESISMHLTGAKKLLPYHGLYPYQRILQMGELFDRTYRTPTIFNSHPELNYSQKIQSLYQPFFAPGVLFNSLRSGVECPWPIYTNATGLEPTIPYGRVDVYTDSSSGLVSTSKIYDSIAPSWYYMEKYQCEDREFLTTRPQTYREVRETRSWKELRESQPKFKNNLNDDCGLLLNRVANSKISLDSLRENSFYENIKKSEKEILKEVETYQYCILEFIVPDIEEAAGFSLYSTGEKKNLSITFHELSSLEKSTKKKYTINKKPNAHDAQIEIESHEFTPNNIEKSVCELFNLHMLEGEYRVVPLDRSDVSIPKPEDFVLENLDLKEIDESLDTGGKSRIRLAIVYIGHLIGDKILHQSPRSFLDFKDASVSTFSGDKSEKLGIRYRDKNRVLERDVDLIKLPQEFGQYNREFYSGTSRVVSMISSQPTDSTGVIRKEEQIYLLAGDHYTGTANDLSMEQAWPSFNWSPISPDTKFQRSVTNFLDETQEFFLKHDKPLRYHTSQSEFQTEPGKVYSMEVFLRKTENFSTTKTISGNSAKYSGPPYRFQDVAYYRKEAELTDDLAFAPFAPAYHYGQAVAKLSFTATQNITSAKELVNNLEISHINKDIEAEYERKFPHTGKDGLRSFITSPAYKGKNNIDSCVNLYEIKEDGSWQISLKSEFPILNYIDSSPTATTPVGFWNNYGIPPKAGEGVYFGIRDTINQDHGTSEGSLIELCTFHDPQLRTNIVSTQENRVGELAQEKEIKEAVLVIPYCETEHIKITEPYALTENTFTINHESGNKKMFFFTTPRDKYDEIIRDSSPGNNSYSKAAHRLKDYILPPELDFIKNKNINPFACYILETSLLLNSKDLANIWQGRLSDKSLSASLISGDNNIFEHNLSETDFYNNKKLPEGTRFMVMKLKQQSKKYPEKEESYNWPYDYFSILEKAKIDFKTVTTPSGGTNG